MTISATPNGAVATAGEAAAHDAGGHKWFVAAMLCAAHTVAIIDRFLMVLVTEPVRAAMHLTDAQLGLLQGTGFALLYCCFAVPLGAVADATNRRNLIMLGLALWSLATAAAAFATSFEMLFATRIIVGFGEACLVPAGMSLLAAYFTPANLARGTAIFGLGANFGYGLAFLGGGVVLGALQAAGGLALLGRQFEPWQAIFLMAGALAAPVIVAFALVREPPRGAGEGRRLGRQIAALRDGLGYIRSNLTGYAPFLLVGAMTSVTGYAVTSWSSSLFVRTHGLTVADAGKLIGLVGVIAGPLGTLCGGYVLDHLRMRGVPGAPLLMMAGGSMIALVTAGSVGFVTDLTSATMLFALFVFESTFVLPALYVGMQLLTPDRFRGVAASVNMMIYTLAGLGFGPAAVGMLSDRFAGSHGLALAITVVEATMAFFLVPIALLARQSYHERMRKVAA